MTAEAQPAPLADAAAAERAAYQRDGFLILPRPVIPSDVLERAVRGMEALRCGNADGGSELRPDQLMVIGTNAGLDNASLCKLELPQLGSEGIRELVSLEAIGEAAARVTGADWVQVWWTQLLGKPGGGLEDTVNIGYHQVRKTKTPCDRLQYPLTPLTPPRTGTTGRRRGRKGASCSPPGSRCLT